MLKNWKSICFALAALIALIPLVSCPSDSGGNNPGNNPNNPNKPGGGDQKAYMVDISNETNFKYLIAGTDGSGIFINVNESTKIPTSLYLKPDKKSDKGISFFLKENGLPDKVVSNGHIMYYSNFRGYQFDMAIIKPDKTIEYHYNIETDVNWDAYRRSVVSRQGRSAKEDAVTVLDVVDHVVGVGTCVLMALAPPGLNAPLIAGCASYVVSEYAELLVDVLLDGAEEDVAKKVIDTINLVIDVGSCAGGDLVDCLQAVSGAVSLLLGVDIDLLAASSKVLGEASMMIDGVTVTWTIVGINKLGYDVTAVAYGDDIFVVGTALSTVAYSTDDGANWTTIINKKGLGEGLRIMGGAAGIDAIAYGNGKFVAVGGSGGGGVAYSEDGETWYGGPDRRFNEVFDIAYGGGKFVAVGGFGKALYSPDGITWTETEMPRGIGGGSIAYGGGKFVAQDGHNVMSYSFDGINWTLVTDSPFSILADITDIACDDDGKKFVAVGTYGEIAYSSDGINWSAVMISPFGTRNSSSTNFHGIDIEHIAYVANGFVAVGNGKMAYSPNGINWTAVSYPDNLGAMAYGSGRVVAAAGDGRIAYSYWLDGFSSSGGGNPVANPGSGKLTINNLPGGGTSFSVFVFKSGTNISTFAGIDAALNSANLLAAGDSPSGGVFTLMTDEGAWTGTGSFPVLLFDDDDSTTAMFRRATISFTNGTGTANLSGFTTVTQ